MSRSLRRLTSTLALTAAMLAIVVMGARDWAARAMVRTPNALRAPTAPGALPEGAVEDLTVTVGPPRAQIRAWRFEPPEGEPRGTLLLFHGLFDRRETSRSGARAFARQGWRVILPDLRGHGSSSGARLGFGSHEVGDAVQLVEHLEARGLLVAPLAVYGRSYGGAVALQLAGREAPHVTAAVSVSTFARFDRLARPYAEQSWPWAAWALPDRGLAWFMRHAAEVGGFAVEDTDVAAAAERATGRMLIVHGDADATVPFTNAESIYTRCRPRCELVRLRGATHEGALHDRTVSQRARRFLAGFLSR